MAWTSERVDTLIKLWTDGHSASQIAAEFGDVSRNAVIGKVHRLGFSGRSRKPAQKTDVETEKVDETPDSGVSIAARSAGGDFTVISEPVKDTARNIIELASHTDEWSDEIEPQSRLLSLLDLSEKTCKWPEGDPLKDDLSFCGHPVRENSPYCPFHAKKAFQG